VYLYCVTAAADDDKVITDHDDDGVRACLGTGVELS